MATDCRNLVSVDQGPDHHANLRDIHSFTPRTSVLATNPNDLSDDLSAGPLGPPTLSAFYTLPPATASPICTPGPVVSLASNEDGCKKSAQNTLVDSRSNLKHPPPTWISTPPTPPPELVRRSVTCRTRHSPGLIMTSSNSFPDSRSSYAPARTPKRRASIAAMYTWRLRSSSDALPATKYAGHEAIVRVSSPLRSALLIPREHNKDSIEPSIPKPVMPIFHIPGDASTDTEDGGIILHESPLQTHFLRDHPPVISWDKGKATDSIRRLYALLELLTTEIGYLSDLRALVAVFLRQLPSLSARPLSRSHSSFSAISRVSSFTYLGTHSVLHQSITPSEGPSGASTGKEEHTLSRPLFTGGEIELLTRNAEEILELHEHFVQELRQAVIPFGLANALEFSGEPERQYPDSYECLATRVDAAIKAVCTKFATESSRFNAYQVFCASHPEALDLIRKVQQQYPLEWHEFEYRCSAMITALIQSEVKPAVNPQSPAPEESLPDPAIPAQRKRTTSLTSIDGAVRTLRSKTGLKSKESIVFPTQAKSSRRLAFMDYMIKPVQRICKYPLLLDQLQPGKHVCMSSSRKTDVQVVVESATQAMRHVAGSVDEARHKQDVAIQSALIVSRISLASSVTHVSQSNSPPQTLTPQFLTSLGMCLFAGPLDVIHHQSGKSLGSRGKIRTKYLGAFLYLGGYFILVKVGKNMVYDPKHWIRLSEFDIINVREDEALLPFSFRFISSGHQFELAASCHGEKEAWLNAIRMSLSESPKWINEPTVSIHCDGKGDLIPSSLDGGPFETINALPTIQSIPELVNHDSAHSTESAPAGPVCERSPPSSQHEPTSSSAPPSRRSSSTSVRSIFSPLTSDFGQVVITRSSATARVVVEQGLHDVISEVCILARSRTTPSEEDLFHTPTITRKKSRSSLTMTSMGLGKNRTSNDSVHIFRRRSFLEGTDTFGRKSLSRTKSLAFRRQAKKLPLISTFNPDPSIPGPELSSSRPSPIPIHHLSSNSNPPSASSSPSEPQTPPIILKGDSDKSSKSYRFVGGMKELFHSRPTSPVVTTSSDPDPYIDEPITKTITPSLFKRWTKGTLSHRRAHSAPEDENTIQNKVSELFDPDYDVHIDTQVLPEKSPVTEVAAAPDETPIANGAPRNTLRRISFFQRLKSIEVG